MQAFWRRLLYIKIHENAYVFWNEEIIQNKERNVCIDIYGSIIYNSKKLEAS